MNKLSVFLPSIRVHLLPEFYKTLEASCSRPFEVVVAGPFEPPQEFLARENVKFVQTFAHPTKSAQLAALACSHELIYHTTDDVLFLPGAVDAALELYEISCQPHDVVSMRYIESLNHENKESFPLNYWTVANSCPVPTLNPSWNINVHFMMKRELFTDYGGFDSVFEYLTQAGADLLVRIQNNGGIVYHSPTDVTTADWSGGSKGKEHLPIQVAQEQFDTPLFYHIWTSQIGTRSVIDVDNHLAFPEKWERRFGKASPKSYNEIAP